MPHLISQTWSPVWLSAKLHSLNHDQYHRSWLLGTARFVHSKCIISEAPGSLGLGQRFNDSVSENRCILSVTSRYPTVHLCSSWVGVQNVKPSSLSPPSTNGNEHTYSTSYQRPNINSNTLEEEPGNPTDESSLYIDDIVNKHIIRANMIHRCFVSRNGRLLVHVFVTEYEFNSQNADKCEKNKKMSKMTKMCDHF